MQKIPCTNILNNIITDDFVETNQNKIYKNSNDININTTNSEFKIFEKRSKNIKNINDK